MKALEKSNRESGCVCPANNDDDDNDRDDNDRDDNEDDREEAFICAIPQLNAVEFG